MSAKIPDGVIRGSARFMSSNEKVRIKLLSGLNVDLSAKVHDECYCNFDEAKYFTFSNIMNSGQYFPQIVQFICVMICICSGRISFWEILLSNLLSGIIFTVIWYAFKLYIIPGINFISCLIGGNIFRLFLHFIVIAVVSIFVIGDWKVIIFCLIGGFITQLIKSILSAKFSSVAYNDEVAIYVSKFKT